MNLQIIQKNLLEVNNPWVAGETSVSGLDQETQILRLGVTPPSGELSMDEIAYHTECNKEQIKQNILSIQSVPSTYDLRNVNGVNYITSIKNQKNCGSCVAFGVLATVEASARFQSKNPNLAIDLSEAQLFFCYGYSEGVNCNTGWWPIYAYEDLRTKGIVDEGCYNYNTGLALQNCRGICTDDKRHKTYIEKYIDLTNNPSQIKKWISSYGPVSACFGVYEDFYYYHSGVYQHTWGSLLGGHCVSIIGYDDTEGCWICKNSWGTNWGESGFFRIGYGECGIESTTNHGVNGVY